MINQEQKENWKIHKDVEIEQYTLEQVLSERRNFKKEIRKYLKANENENTTH